MAKTLRATVAPSLPVAPAHYEARYQDQFSNVLRLYFAQQDNFTQALLENSGGRYISAPHIFLSNSTSQYAGGDNTPTLVQWDTEDAIEGFIRNSDSATPRWSGAYRIDYRLLLENNDATKHNVWVWAVITHDGTAANAAHSCSKFSIPANSYADATGFIQIDLLGGDKIQLFWATDKAAVSGGATGVWMDAYTASTSPFSRPSIPSTYGSITFVSELSE